MVIKIMLAVLYGISLHGMDSDNEYDDVEEELCGAFQSLSSYTRPGTPCYQSFRFGTDVKKGMSLLSSCGDETHEPLSFHGRSLSVDSMNLKSGSTERQFVPIQESLWTRRSLEKLSSCVVKRQHSGVISSDDQNVTYFSQKEHVSKKMRKNRWDYTENFMNQCKFEQLSVGAQASDEVFSKKRKNY